MVKFPMRCFEIYDSGKFIRIRDNWKRRGKGRALSAGKRLDTNESGMPCKLPSSLFISISGSCQPTLRTRSREIPKETTHTRPATDISEPRLYSVTLLASLMSIDSCETLTLLVVRSEIWMFNENVFPFFLPLSQPAKINSRQSKFAHDTTVNKISPHYYIYIGNSVWLRIEQKDGWEKKKKERGEETKCR